MSKIYEALLRAEQDRIASDGKEPAVPMASTSAPAPVAPTDLMPESWPRSTSSSLTGQRLDLSDLTPRTFEEDPTGLASEDQRAVDRNIPFLDLSQVATQVWNPSFEHLPALGERGSSVEQFRSLRSRMHEFRDLNTLKSILVSSGLPQEGKSFIAANVAISFARHKAARVLLIDGDMRRSSLHHLLGCTSEPGLAEYLSGNATILEIMQRAKPAKSGQPLHHGLASLTFIGAGKDSNTAADLSGNYRFDELIKTVSPYFDWIVVDSSPVNLVADGVNLSRACDGVLLVARAGVTKFEVAQRALGELKASNILGFVLNAVPDPPKSGGYYGYGGYDNYDATENNPPTVEATHAT